MVPNSSSPPLLHRKAVVVVPNPCSMLILHQMVGWKACSLWRSFGRLRCRGEGGECAKSRWRQAFQDGQNRKGGGVGGARRRYPRGALDAPSYLVTRDALELLICVGLVPETTGSEATTIKASPGLSLLTKLIFFGVIVGVALTFLRTRKPMVEKSPA